MNIVAVPHSDDNIYNGILSSIGAVHPNTILWNRRYKPAFDMVDELDPKVFICKDDDLTQDVKLALRQCDAQKIVFGVGVMGVDVDLLCVNKNVNDKIVSNITQDFIIVEQKANAVQYGSGQYQNKHSSDIFYPCSLPFEDQHVNSTLPYLCSLSDYRIKLCGPHKIPLPYYLGNCNMNTMSNLLASTKIVLDINHQNMLDAAFMGIFCLSNTESDIYPHFINFKELKEQIEHFINNRKHALYFCKQAKKFAKDHTYLHTTIEMFTKLGLNDMVEKTQHLLMRYV